MILKLGMQHRVLKCYHIPSNDDPMMTFDLFTQRATLFPYAFVWESGLNSGLLRETIEFYDMKAGIYSKLNEYMEIYMCQRSRSFFDLCPR